MLNHCFSFLSKLSKVNRSRKCLLTESRDDKSDISIHYGNLETQSDYDYDSSDTSSIISYEEKLSGNPEIDEFLRSTRFTGNTLHWISYDEFDDIQEIGKGGTATVFVADWRGHYDKRTNDTMKVALKLLHNSENISRRFIDELRAFHGCAKGVYFLKFYGISKNPTTREYILVIQYCKMGSLYNNFRLISSQEWRMKFSVLRDISKDIDSIHNAERVHRGLHPGNILQNENLTSYVSDMGSACPVNLEESDVKGGVYGVLPYVAPEVLQGSPHTMYSDVYSFGIIMWEILVGRLSFSDRAHDAHLQLQIINGLRPEIPEGAPEFYLDTMTRCWDSDPCKRPNASYLYDYIKFWWLDDDKFEMLKEFDDNIKNIRSSSCDDSLEIHPEAIYRSRFISYVSCQKEVNAN